MIPRDSESTLLFYTQVKNTVKVTSKQHMYGTYQYTNAHAVAISWPQPSSGNHNLSYFP